MTAVVKTNPAAPAGFFEAEAAGLRWLADAEARGGARVARVDEVGPGRIAIRRVAPARPDAAAARAFGAALARTHDAGAAAFGAAADGWTGPNFIGRLAQACVPTDAWGVFYARDRVAAFLPGARDAGNLGAADTRVVERACELVGSGVFDDTDPPARLHGDLWSGNVLWSPGGVVMIDPAAHGGHGETDLAMLALFGCPFLDEIVAGYQDVHPLPAGRDDRVPVHQLHPLAVHAVGHGRAYGAALADAALRTLALA
ncbi:fructosamine kinase family protein [Microbacterium thalassium]|uniref:Fructosamine-3-kinase n=1 Tax=Microbacterium thalassium TaxID=362649 RepID=A0A7X0FPW3_9MICO|nr:fructosamine kinase family protein [Microbacterium thalassium]MBB6391494.1 fructosamine-3-kinase [Microbacterium thalassium]GLK24112.1 fructosamine kinase [Microbacterium thalassium]